MTNILQTINKGWYLFEVKTYYLEKSHSCFKIPCAQFQNILCM